MANQITDRFYNAPLREAFLQSRCNPQDVALFAGIVRRSQGVEKPDVVALKRKLGLVTKSNSTRYVSYISRDSAIRIIRALDLSPIDFDL